MPKYSSLQRINKYIIKEILIWTYNLVYNEIIFNR